MIDTSSFDDNVVDVDDDDDDDCCNSLRNNSRISHANNAGFSLRKRNILFTKFGVELLELLLLLLLFEFDPDRLLFLPPPYLSYFFWGGHFSKFFQTKNFKQKKKILT